MQHARIDAEWWHRRIAGAITRRAPLALTTNACRFVHAEGDGLPSLVVDRYDRWLVIQLLSAGLEHFRDAIVGALQDLVRPAGILARHDAAVREREGLARTVETLYEQVPQTIEIVEAGVRYLAAPARRPEDRRVPRPAREPDAGWRRAPGGGHSIVSHTTVRLRCTSHARRRP